MSEEKKYKSYTSADIEKYHKGLLSPKEMNELEKAALDDPFLADALEGYGNVQVNIASDIEGLEKKLEQRVSGAKVVPLSPRYNVYRFLKVAAVVIFVVGAGFLVYKLAFERSENSMAVQIAPKAPQAPVTTDTNKQGTTSIGNSSDIAIGANGSDLKNQQRSVLKNDSAKNSQIIITSGVQAQSSNLLKTEEKTDDKTVAFGASAPAQDSSKISPIYKLEVSPKQTTDNVADVGYDKKSLAQERKTKQAQPGAYNTYNVNAIGVNDNYQRDKEGAAKTNFFRGRVMDNNNNALPFANISNVKDNVGTYADAQGNFTLISSDSVMNVKVKSVGFVTDTLQLQGYLSFNRVVLNEDKAEGLVLSGKRQGKIPTPDQNVQVEESEPADGWNNYNIYLANNIKTPEVAQQKSLHQEVKVSFEINKLGEPVNIKVEKSDCKECNDEAIRLVKEGPKWKSKKKKSRVTLTIPF